MSDAKEERMDRVKRADGDLRPAGYMIRDLRKRHNLTQQQLADSLYGNFTGRIIGDYERGERNCMPLTWWAMVLTWDGRDLWQEEFGE